MRLSEKQKETIRKMVLENSVTCIYDWVLDGTLQRFPAGFWSMPENYDYARICVKHLFEDILKVNINDIPRLISVKLLTEYKLHGMTVSLFNDSVIDILENAYPDKFKPYMLNRVPENYWTVETAAEAIRWLLKDKLQLDREGIVKQYNSALLNTYGFSSIRNKYTLFGLLDIAFPGEFKIWEIEAALPNNYWTQETLEAFAKDLIEHYNFTPTKYTPSQWMSKATNHCRFYHIVTSETFYDITCQVYDALIKEAEVKVIGF